jgi:hypothetical protein
VVKYRPGDCVEICSTALASFVNTNRPVGMQRIKCSRRALVTFVSGKYLLVKTNRAHAHSITVRADPKLREAPNTDKPRATTKSS